MPVNVIELDRGLGNRIVGEGVVTAKEYIDALEQHLSKPASQLEKHLYSISDYSAVTKFEANLAHIAKVAKKSIEVSKVNPDVLIIIIATNEMLYGLAKIWSGLAKLSGWQIRVFKSKDDGESWLKCKMEKKYPELELKYKEQ